MTLYDSDRRVWSGPRIPLRFSPDHSLGEVLLELLDRNPEKPIQVDADTDRTMSRRELRLRAVRIAQHLQSDYGYGVNDIATIAALSSENLSPVAVALQCMAVPYNALFPNFTVAEMADMMRQTQSRFMLCDAWNYETVRDAARMAVDGDVRIFIMSGSVRGVPSVNELLIETGRESEFLPERVEDSSKSIYSIFCSSGTTGPPKGICLSHANKISSFVLPTFDHSTCLAMGSIHWISVAFTHDMAIFYECIVVITSKPFSEDHFFDLVEKYKVNCLNCPPVYANALTQHPRANQANLSSLKLLGIGGYFVPDEVRDAVDAILPDGKSYTIYASTEAGLIASDLAKRKRGAVGTVFPNVQIRIVDDDGQTLGIGEQGELWIKRTIPFLGYFKNENATMASLDSEKWFKSEDLGYFDEEGFLYLVGRKGDIFKYINQVSPSELEAVVAQVQGVAQVCIVGIPTNDRTAHMPTAVVVKTAGSAVTKEEIEQFVAERVMDHKRLRGGVYFVDQLPTTSKGNVKRKDVLELILGKVTMERR